jgi:hypothetical protein
LIPPIYQGKWGMRNAANTVTMIQLRSNTRLIG